MSTARVSQPVNRARNEGERAARVFARVCSRVVAMVVGRKLRGRTHLASAGDPPRRYTPLRFHDKKKRKKKGEGGTHVVGTIIRKVCFLSALVSPIGIRASPQRTWNYARIRGAQLPLPALRNRSLSASLFVPFSLFLRPISVWRWKSFFSLLGEAIRWIRFFPIEIDVK